MGTVDALTYAYWPPNTRFYLTNVPWDSSYRDIVRFEDDSKRQAWFNAQPHITVERGTMSRFGQPVRLEIPFNQASQWNYLVAYNDYPAIDTPRRWYYFIQNVRYINANVTEFVIMLDVWQSFCYDVTFGRCYVERGHVGIANGNVNDATVRDYLTLPEGLDTGAEMTTGSHVWRQLYDVTTGNADDRTIAQVNFSVLVVSTVNLTRDGGNMSNPQLFTATGSYMQNQPNGTNVYVFTKVDDFMNAMFNLSGKPWMAQGIVAIYAVPSPTTSHWFDSRDWDPVTVGEATAYTPKYSPINSVASNGDMLIQVNNVSGNFNIPERYRNLRKLRTYPYAAIEVTCNNGATLMLRPELLDDDRLTLWGVWNMAPPSPRMMFYPRGYNSNGNPSEWSAGSDGYGVEIDGGDFLETAVGIANFPQFCIVNNNATLMIANQAHSLAWSYDSADWSYQKTQMGINNAVAQAQLSTEYATRGNQLAIGNRNANLSIAQNQTNQATALANDYALKQQGVNTAASIANGVVGSIGSIASGNIAGGISNIVGTGIGVVAQAASTNLSNENRSANAALSNVTAAASTTQANTYGSQTTALSNEQTMAMANMNAAYANAAAQGDYNNTIAGINAKVQDTKLTPPSTVGQMGGDAFNHALSMVGVLVKFKTCAPSALRSIGEYWLRYGYYVQRFMTPPTDLACMEHFTYWKLQESTLTSQTCPEEYRMTIKGVFEKGVTVWKSPDDIATLDIADNDPITGIAY